MKLIGITGSSGKTSVAEIIYQYLVQKNISTSLYCSNGLFINGLTRQKDFLQSTVYDKELENYLKEDEEYNVEYAIIEITAESIKRKENVHRLNYEVIGLTNFFKGLCNHFKDEDEYLACKREILSGNTKRVLLRIEDNNYSLFSDINHKTYGYSDEANYSLKVYDNTKDGLSLSYDGVDFTSNLITGYHARNLACALAILKAVNEIDMNEFKRFANTIEIRGRFEKIVINNKTIVIDTGFVGADILLIGLERTFGHKNFRVVYSNYHYNYPTSWVYKARKRVGEYLKETKHIYLTNPENNENEEKIFLNDVICNDKNILYSYIPDYQEAINKALNDLSDDEVLVIFARKNYRLYRNYLETLNKEKVK